MNKKTDRVMLDLVVRGNLICEHCHDFGYPEKRAVFMATGHDAYKTRSKVALCESCFTNSALEPSGEVILKLVWENRGGTMQTKVGSFFLSSFDFKDFNTQHVACEVSISLENNVGIQFKLYTDLWQHPGDYNPHVPKLSMRRLELKLQDFLNNNIADAIAAGLHSP